jgi:hypothetical protein
LWQSAEPHCPRGLDGRYASAMPPSSPATTRRSSANAPQRAGASQRKVIRHRLRFSAPPFRSAEWQVGTWCKLLSALRAAGIHAPSDVDRDIVEDGRVSGRRMIIVWDEDGGFYGIVERLAQETLAADSRFLLINNEVAVEDVVQSVMAHFSGPGQGSPEAAA